MLDLHSHILSGIDDGAPDMETALEMAGLAVGAGIKTMVATPHYLKGTMENSAAIVRAKVGELQQALDGAGIQLKVLPGAEVYLDPETPVLLKKGELMTVNDKGKYLLVELPMAEIPRYTEEVLFEIKVQGVTPVIAHPERNLAVCSEPRLAGAWAEKGCLLQVNAGSILGIYGPKVKKTALWLIRQGLVHVMGSDMHGVGERCRAMKGAVERIEEIRAGIGEAVVANGEKIVKGEEVGLGLTVVGREGQRSFWRRLFG